MFLEELAVLFPINPSSILITDSNTFGYNTNTTYILDTNSLTLKKHVDSPDGKDFINTSTLLIGNSSLFSLTYNSNEIYKYKIDKNCWKIVH